MATKKKVPQWQIDALGLGLSIVGGGLGSVAMTQADLRIPKFQEMPILSPLGAFLIGSIVVFVTPKAVKPLGYGIVGVSGGSGADMAMNGLTRIEIQGDEIQGRIDNSEEEIERLSRINEAIQNAAEDAEYMEDDGTN